MAGGLTPEVRLVRCPKCRNVLPEVPYVPVYKCGGCDTVLIAKNRKLDAKSMSTLRKTDAAKTDDKSECKEPNPISHDSFLPSSEECLLEKNEEKGDMESIDRNSKQLGVVIVVKNEDEDNRSQQDESENSNIEKSGVSNEVCSSVEDVHESEEISPIAPENPKKETNDASADLAGAESEEDMKDENQTNYTYAPAAKEGNLSIPAHMPAAESISGDVEPSLDRESGQPLESGRHPFDRVVSIDTIATSDFFSPSSELSGEFDYLSKSATTKSSRAYYEGSVSSYDGRDDQFCGQDIKCSVNAREYTRLVLPQEWNSMLDKDKFLANNVMSSNFGMQKKAANMKHHAIRGNTWDGDEFLKPSRLGHPVRNWTRLDRDEYHSRVPSYPTVCDTSGPSSRLGNLSLRSLETAEQEQLKLLRIIYELQDQLNRTNLLSVRASAGVNWKQKSAPVYYDGGASDESYNDFNYSRHRGKFGPGCSYSQQNKFFSGGATTSGHQTDNSCFCCHSQDWQRSRQLSIPALQYNKRFSRFPSAYIHSSLYASDPSSVKTYNNSEFLMQHSETHSDDQRHRDNEMKIPLRERRHVVKHHVRPTAGGAPFVTCYFCLKPLQLPEDFLIFKKSCHRLKCGACSRVLKFSLGNGNHIAQYRPCHVDPPPSHVDDNIDNIKNSSLPSTYDDRGAGTVSCSEDYGVSSIKSLLTDGDPVFLAPYHNFQNDTALRKMSYDSSEERREVFRKQFPRKQKNPREIFDHESVAHSSNMDKREKKSSEFKELQPARGSPLHHLMGYDSPSQVLRGSKWSASATSSDHSEDLSCVSQKK